MIRFIDHVCPSTAGQRTPEEQFLLLCLRQQIRSEQLAEMHRLAKSSLNWEQVSTLVRNHSVVGQVYNTLQLYMKKQVPETFLAQLNAQNTRIAVRDITLTAELLQISRVFQENQLKVLPLKGPALANSIYEKSILRQFNDLDLLVPQGEFQRAEERLISIGYQLQREWHIHLPKFTNDFQRDYHHVYYNHRNQITVELHWALASPNLYPLVVDKLWNSMDTITLAGEQIMVLPPQELFLMLAIHGYRHLWARLKWLVDMAVFIEHYPDFDWGELFRKAEQLGVKRIVVLNLWLAHIVLDAQLPEVAFEALTSDCTAVLPLIEFLVQYIFEEKHSLVQKAKAVLFITDGREKLRDKILHSIQYTMSFISRRSSTLIRCVGYVALFLVWIVYKMGQAVTNRHTEFNVEN